MNKAWGHLIFLLIVISFISLHADEGMWLPHQMKELHLKQQGLLMEPGELYKKDGTGLMNAVVSFGGGTGEFVSGDGLLLTNHHVAFGALQRASDPEHNYLQDGFLARKREEEITAPGYHADVLLGYEEITDKVLSQLQPDMSAKQQYETIDKIKKSIISETEKSAPDIRAEVKAMYSGNQYYLFKFKRIKDIRIVYAPPRDLGNFGGDVDNWMWPRHTADFSFLRAYVSKEGIGAEFSTDNVPYHPKSYLTLSTEGVDEDDFTFVIGYPARTYRNYTLAELDHAMQTMADRITFFKDIVTFFEKASEQNESIELKYASKIRGLNNAMKNYTGKLEGLHKYRIPQKKRAADSAFQAWVKKDTRRQEKYGDILTRIDQFMNEYAAHQRKVRQYKRLTGPYRGPALLWQAYLIYRTAEEQQKPDMERETYYQERNIPEIKQRIQLAERSFHPETDREYMAFLLKRMSTLPAAHIPAALEKHILNQSDAEIKKFVNTLYNNTDLFDPEKRLKMIHQTPAELLALNDPMLQLAADLAKEMKTLRQEGKIVDQKLKDLKKIFLDGLLKMNKGRLAPDANSTIRFTYGFVRGYSPRDAVYYRPQTTLTGVLEKDTGEFPFRVPGKLKMLAENQDFGMYEDKQLEDIPVCFLNTTNVTGGNSGSPTLNAKGEQVGIIFDMTYESVIGDYYVIPELQRTISVDIGYVLFIAEKFSGATNIIEELGL